MTTEKEIELFNSIRPKFGKLILIFQDDRIVGVKKEDDLDRKLIDKVYRQ